MLAVEMPWLRKLLGVSRLQEFTNEEIISIIIHTCRLAKCGYIGYCFFVCNFVRLQISPPKIKLVASNIARRFIGVLAEKVTFLI